MTPFCQTDIESEEGFEAQAYPDPLSPLAAACEAADLLPAQYRLLAAWRSYDGSPWTDGYGETDATINADSTINQSDAAAFVAQRIESVDANLRHAIRVYATLDDARQDVLINMAYELGVEGLLAFKQTLAYLAAGQYEYTAAAMLQSRWAAQVPSRAQRLSLQMKTGERNAL